MSAGLRVWLEMAGRINAKPSSPSGFIGDPAAPLDSRQRHAGMTMLCCRGLI
jgi:hypothetical protein